MFTTELHSVPKACGLPLSQSCHLDSCSYKLNRCYWCLLRASLFSHCLFPLVFFSPYIQRASPISLISLIRYICYVSSNSSRSLTFMDKQTDYKEKQAKIGYKIIIKTQQMSQNSESIPICIIHFTVHIKCTSKHNMTVHHMNPEAP